MFTNYKDAVEWIHSRLKFGIKPGLKRMEWMMERLGNPEKKIPIIHIAGTNGKGSTVSYLQNIFTEAGYKVGTFTSPYIEVFNERISVDGEPISDDEMVALVNEIKPLSEQLAETELNSPTEFEVITAMAFYYFGVVNPPDIIILETGLGGRFDSTNIVEPILSIITNVGFDHMAILGDTIEEIAGEKAGIIKENAPVITGVGNEKALAVIQRIAEEKNVALFALDHDIKITESSLKENQELFSLSTPFRNYEDLLLTMRGEHQLKNASLAVTAINYLQEENKFPITEKQLRTGLEKTSWKGRFETMSKDPLIIIDGAHNIEGVESLVDVVNRHYGDRKIHILFSALADKDFKPMIERLTAIATSMAFTTFDFPRAASAVDLYEACPMEDKRYYESWEEALEKFVQCDDDVYIVTGSLYFISGVRRYLMK
ncbi:folylpolyglutamate synthase/dihydrofolate synthase family protein [Metabacillus fastidiosus]|uniref:bifunctional folylpolyglutamate synthase/dihydrofolate synthase n=1 Tax=Metabacillus fastidiosus TaxID=1458 RepID=UPI002E21FC76|nr:bifunctional folylpolyglutamate synthase/dihydrofolate synthase [Metabacillus fastidiosus]